MALGNFVPEQLTDRSVKQRTHWNRNNPRKQLNDTIFALADAIETPQFHAAGIYGATLLRESGLLCFLSASTSNTQDASR